MLTAGLPSLAETSSVATSATHTSTTIISDETDADEDATSSDAGSAASASATADDEEEQDQHDGDTVAETIARLVPQKTDIRHQVSLANYVKHCRQQHEAFFGPTPPPSTATPLDKVTAETKPTGSTSRRNIQWDPEPPIPHQIPPIPETQFSAVWFTLQDFERQERDINLTIFRWQNHLNGEMTFDAVNNSIRGLEHHFRDAATKAQLSSKRVHRRAVLQEVQRQQQQQQEKQSQQPKDTTSKIQWDHETIRQVSLEKSQADLEKCIQLGQEDYDQAVQAWIVPPPSAPTSTATKSTALPPSKKKGRKGGGGGGSLARFFGKKK